MKLILRTALFLFLLCFCKNTEIQAKVLESGTCGEGIIWEFSENGVLNIHGNGAIVSSPWTEQDWWIRNHVYPYQKDEKVDPQGIYVKRVVVGEGITSIGDYAFSGGEYSSIQLPESLTSIGVCAFENCESLKKLLIPDQVTNMKNNAFDDCVALRIVQIPKQLKRSCGAPSFEGNYRLRKVINHSRLALPVNTQENNLTWKVNGKTVKKVAAGKTAKVIPKKFRIRYQMNGAVLKGKKKTSYKFGEIINLPRNVTKKGWIFYTWDYSSSSFDEGSDDAEFLPACGDVTLTPKFIRCSLTQDKKRTVRATVDATKAEDPDDTIIVIRYFTNPKKKNSAPCKVISGNNKATFVFPKLKRGRRYYFQVSFKATDSDWDEDGKSYWMRHSVWYSMGSVKIRS